MLTSRRNERMQILSNPCVSKIGSFCRCQTRFPDNLPIEAQSPHGDTQLDDNSVHDDWRSLNSRHYGAASKRSERARQEEKSLLPWAKVEATFSELAQRLGMPSLSQR
jgi:hypothetical protein